MNEQIKTEAEVLLSAKGLYKSYPQGRQVLEILKNIDFEVRKGEAVCILGASGAGKSTLLHILGTLDRPTQGQVFFRGKEVFENSDDQLARFRNHTMGFVFQFHHLLSEFNAIENIMMPCRIAGLSNQHARGRADELLQILGISERAKHYPSELSGGEQQRVAIARALVMRPQILFADEPTGNLDSANGSLIQDIFFDLQKELAVTLIVVTHDQGFAAGFPRRLELLDGEWK